MNIVVLLGMVVLYSIIFFYAFLAFCGDVVWKTSAIAICLVLVAFVAIARPVKKLNLHKFYPIYLYASNWKCSGFYLTNLIFDLYLEYNGNKKFW